MANSKRKTPDFFNDDGFNPVESATGYSGHSPKDQNAPSSGIEAKSGPVAKKKAGFYLSVDVLERFNLKFHELKLAGIAIENKSALLETALSYALDDLDKGEESEVLQRLSS